MSTITVLTRVIGLKLLIF